MALGEYRARFMDGAQDLKDQVALLSQVEAQARRYQSRIGDIMSLLQQYGQAANVPQANMSGLQQALDNVAASRHARAAPSRISMDNTKKQYLLEILENAGVDEATLNQLRMMM